MNWKCLVASMIVGTKHSLVLLVEETSKSETETSLALSEILALLYHYCQIGSTNKQGEKEEVLVRSNKKSVYSSP